MKFPVCVYLSGEVEPATELVTSALEGWNSSTGVHGREPKQLAR